MYVTFFEVTSFLNGKFQIAISSISHTCKSSFNHCLFACCRPNVVICSTERRYFITFVRFMRLHKGMLRKMRLPVKNGKNGHGNLIFTTFIPKMPFTMLTSILQFC